MDVDSWLASKALSRPHKNLLHSFSDGVLVAELIASHYPGLLDLHAFSEAHSLDGKRANWEMLNVSTAAAGSGHGASGAGILRRLRCPLSQETIDRFVMRRGRPGDEPASLELREWLQLLRMKLAAYEPVFLAEKAERERKQRERDRKRLQEGTRKEKQRGGEAARRERDDQKAEAAAQEEDNGVHISRSERRRRQKAAREAEQKQKQQQHQQQGNETNTTRSTAAASSSTASAMPRVARRPHSHAPQVTPALRGTTTSTVSSTAAAKQYGRAGGRQPQQHQPSSSQRPRSGGSASGSTAAESSSGGSGTRFGSIMDNRTTRDPSPRLAALTEADLEQMYSKVSSSLRGEVAETTALLNELDRRSSQLDSDLTELREQNLHEMETTDKRIAKLQLDLDELTQGKNGTVAEMQVFLDAAVAEENLPQARQGGSAYVIAADEDIINGITNDFMEMQKIASALPDIRITLEHMRQHRRPLSARYARAIAATAPSPTNSLSPGHLPDAQHDEPEEVTEFETYTHDYAHDYGRGGTDGGRSPIRIDDDTRGRAGNGFASENGDEEEDEESSTDEDEPPPPPPPVLSPSSMAQITMGEGQPTGTASGSNGAPGPTPAKSVNSDMASVATADLVKHLSRALSDDQTAAEPSFDGSENSSTASAAVSAAAAARSEDQARTMLGMSIQEEEDADASTPANNTPSASAVAAPPIAPPPNWSQPPGNAGLPEPPPPAGTPPMQAAINIGPSPPPPGTPPPPGVGADLPSPSSPPPPQASPGPPPATDAPVALPPGGLPLPMVEWKMETDPATQKQYYLNINSGQSQWVAPTSGVVECSDAASGYPYYLDAKTHQCGWTLFELSLLMSGPQQPPPAAT